MQTDAFSICSSPNTITVILQCTITPRLSQFIMSIVPFEIHVPEPTLERLKQKLALTDFPNENPCDAGSSWDQGPPVAEIKRLAGLWQTSYDWRKVETHLNTLPQYLAPVEVDGFGVYQIHHIHQRSTRPDAIPLLFLHGWPGSFFEVTKMLDDLVQGEASSPAFHVIAPSLIDFGFSSPSGKVRGKTLLYPVRISVDMFAEGVPVRAACRSV